MAEVASIAEVASNEEGPNTCKSKSYKDFYVYALRSLGEELQEKVNGERNNGKKKLRFLSLGRKGAKLYECLSLYTASEDKRVIGSEKSKEYEDIDIISEHALPFISRIDESESDVVYCLLDDGLYYGSSAIGLAKAVYGFEKIFGKHTPTEEKISYFGAIDTGELRLNFDRYIGEVKAKKTSDAGLAKGYSHYFVKRLSSDIRSFENTFEIEFPIVTFKLDFSPIKEHWESVVKEVFKDTGAKVYTVEHAENFSVNVLLPNTGGSSFKKIRIFPHNPEKYKDRDDYVNVVCMAPYPIADDDLTLSQLFDYAGEDYKELWEEIYERCNVQSSYINADTIVSYLNLVRPRCNRSLVIMANYLLSYSVIIEQRDKLENVFSLLGVKADFKGIKAENLYYLLGDKDFSQAIGKRLQCFYNTRTECGDIITNKELHVNYPVFENSKNMEENYMYLFDLQNDFMMEKSQNMEEALSALFVNQDVFFEKQILAGNPITQDYNRLRLGYTYEGLHDTIQEAFNKGYFTFGSDEDFTITLHRWVDQRIGEASIVPQYIHDEKSHYWVRVFRHGENEDTLLSHLARFVLLVYNERDEKTKLGWIWRDEFEELLTRAYKAIEEIGYDKNQIVESMNIELYVDDEDGKLKYRNTHYNKTEKVGAPRDVLQYMIDMCILSEDEFNDAKEKDMITIHPRTKFYLKNDIFGITTMDSNAEAKVKHEIAEYVGYTALNTTTV